MLTIQQVGSEILSGNPRNMYIMTGPEYGIKSKYISALVDKFGCIKEVGAVMDIIKLFETKHVFPPQPAVYVVRYDDSFIQNLDDKLALRVKNTNISGVLVCIYDGEKYQSKLDKYLPDNSVYINTVDTRFVRHYIKSDFPKLSDRMIDTAVRLSSNYSHAQNIARLLSHGDAAHLEVTSDSVLTFLFGVNSKYDDSELRLNIAAKNFNYLMKYIDTIEDDGSSMCYSILNTLVELEKVKTNSHVDSYLREYVSKWSLEDIYNMFMQTYSELTKLRTISQSSQNSLVYLASLLNFKSIPSIEVMS